MKVVTQTEADMLTPTPTEADMQAPASIYYQRPAKTKDAQKRYKGVHPDMQ